MSKTENEWILRGILAIIPIEKPGSSCDGRNYALFVDIAKHKKWIAKVIGSI